MAVLVPNPHLDACTQLVQAGLSDDKHLAEISTWQLLLLCEVLDLVSTQSHLQQHLVEAPLLLPLELKHVLKHAKKNHGIVSFLLD